MGRTQVGQRTQMAHSALMGWADSPFSHIQQCTARSGPSAQAYLCVGGVQISLPNEGKKTMALREQSNIIT